MDGWITATQFLLGRIRVGVWQILQVSRTRATAPSGLPVPPHDVIVSDGLGARADWDRSGLWFWTGPGRCHTYLEGGGAVGEVHARDEPAVRGLVGRPQPVVEVVPVRSEVEPEGTASADLVDQPDAAPVPLVQNRADQNRPLMALQGGGVYEDQMS